MIAALAGQAVAVVLFATADSFTPLLIGRVIQGLATGAALGALGAAMIETHRIHGTVANAAAPGAGTGLGAIAAGLVIGYLPWPTHLIYLLLLGVLSCRPAGSLLLDGQPRRSGSLADLRPRVAVPPDGTRGVCLRGPGAVRRLGTGRVLRFTRPGAGPAPCDSNSVALGGLGLFILAGVASLTTIVLRNISARPVMIIGVVTLLVGVSGNIIAIRTGSAVGYFVATAVAGAGFGAGFQGGIRTMVPLAETGAASRAALRRVRRVLCRNGCARRGGRVPGQPRA